MKTMAQRTHERASEGKNKANLPKKWNCLFYTERMRSDYSRIQPQTRWYVENKEGRGNERWSNNNNSNRNSDNGSSSIDAPATVEFRLCCHTKNEPVP